MPDSQTRRRLLLALAGGGSAGLAGCNTQSKSSESAPETTDTPTESTTRTATQSAPETDTPTTTAEPPEPSLQTVALTDSTVGQFQPLYLEIAVANTGGRPFRGRRAVDVDGKTVDDRRVTVPAGDTVTWSIPLTLGTVGEHDVSLDIARRENDEQVAEAARRVEVTRYPDQFVGVDGTEFTCGDGTLYLNGSNDQQIIASQVPESRIEQVFGLADDLGMNVMRVFGFAPAWSEQAAQPSPGEYNEEFFQRFDRIIAAAKRHSMRLVVPLVGNRSGPDGISTYVDWVDEASGHNDFYEVERCRELYKGYVEHVLTRTNPLTGLEYREDPTIMLWELGNELNCKWPKKYPLDWIREMGAFVKELDSHHLLSTGVRGNQWGDDPNDKQSYKDGITSETTVIRDHEPDVIDAASVHFYPKTYEFDDRELLRDFIRSAHEMLDKPVYIGEFNWNVDLSAGESLSTRNEHLSAWYDIFAEEGLNAAIVHEISTPAISELKSGSRGTHNIIPQEDEETSEIIRSHSRWVRKHSTASCPETSSESQ